MNNLQNLQTAFKCYLLEGDAEIAAHIVSTPALNSDTRLAIYGNAYRSRLVEALANDYPALQYLLGEGDFSQLCLDYIKTYPSHYTSLRWFGQDLVQFLENSENYCSQPHLAELAKFEWAFIDAFDAEDCNVLSVDDVAKVASELWSELRFT
jgi:hypothetical protein